MVQVIETGNPQGRIAEMLGMSLGESIGNGLNTFFANRSLESVLKDKALQNAPVSKKLEAIRAALSPYGEKGKEIFNQRLQIEQQGLNEAEKIKNEAIQKEKGKALGKYLNGEYLTPEEQGLFTPNEFISMYKAKNYNKGNNLKNIPLSENELESVKKFGGEALSQLWPYLSQGGKTAAIQTVFQARERNIDPNEIFQDTINNNPNIINNQSIKNPEQNQNNNISPTNAPQLKNPQINPIEDVKKNSWPEIKKPIGMSRANQDKLTLQFGKENRIKYDELSTKSKALDSIQDNIKIMKDLNQRGNLPNGGWKTWLTIDPKSQEPYPLYQVSGNVPPDVQRFVKTLNAFAKQASEYFPGRVTNFDLATFMKTVPSLINTPEGRNQILDQMEIQYDIEKLDNDSIMETIAHYGAGNIDPVEVGQIANERSRDIKQELRNKFYSIGTDSMSPGSIINVQGPDGKPYQLNPSQLKRALEEEKEHPGTWKIL